jgi:hypothetical protein
MIITSTEALNAKAIFSYNEAVMSVAGYYDASKPDIHWSIEWLDTHEGAKQSRTLPKQILESIAGEIPLISDSLDVEE